MKKEPPKVPNEQMFLWLSFHKKILYVYIYIYIYIYTYIVPVYSAVSVYSVFIVYSVSVHSAALMWLPEENSD